MWNTNITIGLFCELLFFRCSIHHYTTVVGWTLICSTLYYLCIFKYLKVYSTVWLLWYWQWGEFFFTTIYSFSQVFFWNLYSCLLNLYTYSDKPEIYTWKPRRGLKLFASLFALRVIVPVIHAHRVHWCPLIDYGQQPTKMHTEVTLFYKCQCYS